MRGKHNINKNVNNASLSAQLAMASIQQISGHPDRNVFAAARNPQPNTHGIDAFYHQ